MLCLVTSKRCERGCSDQMRCGINHFAQDAGYALGRAEPARDPLPLDVADFLHRLLDPDDLGHAVSDEVRQIARSLLK